MKHPKFLRFVLVIALLATSLAAIPQRPATAEQGAPSISSALSAWLANAADLDTFQTIITFDNYGAMSRLDDLGVGATKLESLPIAFATLSAAQIQDLLTWPEVRSLWHDEENELYLDESVASTGADRVWTGDGLRSSYTGIGVNVAVIDTGVDTLHPDLPSGSKVDAFYVAGSPFESEPMVVMNANPGTDVYGHGTHVSSIVGGLGAASGGQYTGMAPGARIFNFKTDVGAVLLNSFALGAFDWILSHPEANIRISTNSWGCCGGEQYDPANPVNVATKALYDAGVTVIFAAGNAGGPNTITTYAQSPWVISVAAAADPTTLADFSSRGRLDDNWNRRTAQANNSGLYRPSISAPGVDILAAKSAEATLMAQGVDPNNPFYTVASGTSMAAPHVAGAVALMLEARPTLTPQMVIDILEGTASNMPDYEFFEAGVGFLNAYRAVKAAERGKINFRPPVNGRTPHFELVSEEAFSGTVLAPNWDLAQCPDNTGLNLLNHHEFQVGNKTDLIYAEIDWELPTNLIYLVVYDPDCNEVASSAALLDIGEVNHRAVVISAPAAGTWTVAVYGRLNLPTDYTGILAVYDKTR